VTHHQRYTDESITIRADFECGNGTGFRAAPDGYHVDLQPEPGEHAFGGKAYYFCVALENQLPHPRDVRVWLHGHHDGKFGEGTRYAVLHRSVEPGASFSTNTAAAALAWQQLGPEHITWSEGEDTVCVTVPLPGSGETAPVCTISNYHWHPFSSLVPWVDEIRASSEAEVTVCGQSVAGHPLFRIDVGNPDGPAILMTQTPQPAEMGTWAIRAIVDYLLSEAPEAERMKQRFRFVFLPETNPDGRDAGLGVSHPSGRMPYFEGDLTVDHPDQALPEMHATWAVVSGLSPLHFIEWHSNHWDRRPGHVLLRLRPQLIADAGRRQRWERIDDALLALPETHHGNWTGQTEGMYQCSLVYQATTRLGTISHMIKQHDKYDLAANLEHAVACLHVLTEA
jgi:hypothetical protein